METSGERPRLLLGLDVGTQSLRAALVDVHGRTVAFGIAPIETTYPQPTWAEQQPLAWWSAAVDAVRLALAKGNVDTRPGHRRSASTARPAPSWLRYRRRAAPPCPALDGPACFPRGSRDQRHRRSRLAVRLGPGLSRVDAAQGPLAQAKRAGCLRPCRSGSSNAPTG